jgi:hypothetical protein
MVWATDSSVASKMENTYFRLLRELPEIERQCKGEAQLIEHAMCSRLLALFFGWDWYQGKIAFRDDADEWMHNQKADTGLNRILYHKRVVQLGDAIFTLLWADFKGGDILRQRFLTRTTRPCYVETEIASLLAYNGFLVEVIGESGVRGQDFDLAASKGGATVSIEITAKEDGPLAVQSIRNTLRSKRTQVPSHRPAVLYMQIPSEWMAPENHGLAIFTEAFGDFFQRSRRFNACVLVWEEVVPFKNGAFSQTNLRACYNNNPRHPFSARYLLAPSPSSDGRNHLAYSFMDWLKSLGSKTPG